MSRLWKPDTFSFRRGQARLAQARALTARVRRTHQGVRIKLGDGRITWFQKDDETSEECFMQAIEDWLSRHGVDRSGVRFE